MAFEWIIIECRREIRMAQVRRHRAGVARFSAENARDRKRNRDLTASASHKQTMINIEEFFKVEIKIGKILSVEKVEGSEKLLKLMVDLGEGAPRQILSGVAKAVSSPEELVGKLVPIVANLEPRQMMGMESQGMMLCADGEMPVFLHPARDVNPGSVVK